MIDCSYSTVVVGGNWRNFASCYLTGACVARTAVFFKKNITGVHSDSNQDLIWLGKMRRMVVTHVPTEDLPEGVIYRRILPTNRGSRSNNPRLNRRGGPCWLTRTRSLSSPRSQNVEGSLLALNTCITKKTAALGGGSKLPLHPGLL